MAVPSTIPTLANASGKESTPPPTIVATRLNVPKNELVFRRGESDGGFKSSSDSVRLKDRYTSRNPILLELVTCGGMVLSFCCTGTEDWVISAKVSCDLIILCAYDYVEEGHVGVCIWYLAVGCFFFSAATSQFCGDVDIHPATIVQKQKKTLI